MHNIHNQTKRTGGPETRGTTIHWAAHYDIMSSLFGMGVNGRNTKMVISLVTLKPGESVLDVGCGSGNLTLRAKIVSGPGGKVYGIDASPEMIEVAQNKAKKSGQEVTFQLGLMERLSFTDNTFDVVISRLAIHHLPDDVKPKAFAEILRVLKPGGRVFITDFIPPKDPILNHIFSGLVGNHMMQTDIWSLPPLMKIAGFTEIEWGRTRSVFLAFVSGKKPDIVNSY